MVHLLASFGNLFSMDPVIIFLVLLLLFGAKKLPELARGLGQSLNEFKRAKDDFTGQLHADPPEVAVREARDRQARDAGQSAIDLQRQVEELQSQLRAAQQHSQTPQLVESSSTDAAHVTAPSQNGVVRPS